MTVYVDDFRIRARVGRLNGQWSHLTAGPFDDLAELHELAARIGLKRNWFQPKPWPRAHYDVLESKRLEAIAAGAVPVSWRDAGMHLVHARRAWKAVAGDLAPTRAPAGCPPGAGELWRQAGVLWEAAVTVGADFV